MEKNHKSYQRVRLTKQLLFEALIKLLEKKELRKISIVELCKAAGINRSTFYLHYGSQYDVLEDMGDIFIEGMSAVYAEMKDPNERTIEKQISITCQYLLDHKQEANALFKYYSAESKFGQKVMALREDMNPGYKNFIKNRDAETTDYANTFISNGVYSVVRKWLLNDSRKTPEEMGQLAVQLTQFTF
jgi:AcrR family transcriptional regulator